MLRAKLLVILCFLSVCCGFCGTETNTAPRFELAVHTVELDGSPVRDAQVFVGDTPVGRSGVQGKLRFELSGKEGRRVAIRVKCPIAYQQQELLDTITLHQVLDVKDTAKRKAIERKFVCNALINKAVVLVKSNAPAGLPVLLDGREVDRTNEHGIAHVYIEMAPQAEFQVKISTTSQPELRPQEPSRVFRMPEGKEILLFEQDFSIEEAPKVRKRSRRRRVKKRSSAPVRLK
ncbi:MAG: hypothetical protein IPJ88_06130 [Myxococcales bacterium]|nr:MAG: hypothetical protein IPJ88_06130 [Myxococcales bacterium]